MSSISLIPVILVGEWYALRINGSPRPHAKGVHRRPQGLATRGEPVGHRERRPFINISGDKPGRLQFGQPLGQNPLRELRNCTDQFVVPSRALQQQIDDQPGPPLPQNVEDVLGVRACMQVEAWIHLARILYSLEECFLYLVCS